MKTRILTSVLGSLLAATFIITPVFAYHPHDDDGYGDYGYDDDGYSDGDREYSYGGYQDDGYERSPRYGNGRSRYDDYGGYGYEHPSGLLGYWGKDARHHSRGDQHHHVF